MTEYQGAYDAFDFSKVSAHPIAERSNRVTQDDLIDLNAIGPAGLECSVELDAVALDAVALDAVAAAIREARGHGRPVIWMMGAHPVKLGLSPIIIDLMERGLLTTSAGTARFRFTTSNWL